MRTSNRWQRQGLAWRREPRLSGMLGISLGLHLFGFLLAAGFLTLQPHTVRKPVYMVDLVNLPVLKPQAGRPDGRSRIEQPAPPKPATVKPSPPAPVKPKPKPVVKPKPQPKPVPKPAPVVKPKPEPRTEPKKSYDDVLQEIAKKRREQERAELSEKLKALTGKDTRSAGSDAPLGEPSGRGADAGVSFGLWLQSYYTANWKLSKYQIPNLALEARIEVDFDPRGFLKNYRFVQSSGNDAFDNSLKATILSLDKLPKEPGERFVEIIYFNLKDMQER